MNKFSNKAKAGLAVVFSMFVASSAFAQSTITPVSIGVTIGDTVAEVATVLGKRRWEYDIWCKGLW